MKNLKSNTKLTIIRIVMTMMILVSLHTANAEIRRNNDGLKLVKTLKVTLLSSSGELGWFSLNADYAFDYDDEGNMTKITRKSIDENDKRIVETLYKDNGGYHYQLTENGKRNPNVKYKYVTNFKGDISSRTTDISERDPVDREHIHRFKESTIYKTPWQIINWSFYGTDSYSEIENYLSADGGELSYFLSRDMDLLRTDNMEDENFKEIGFVKSIVYLMSNDSIFYYPSSYIIDRYTVEDGNIIEAPCSHNTYKKWIYSDEQDDINLNLLPLSNLRYIGDYSRNIEAVSEWIGMKSKNRILYEGWWSDRLYDVKWEYEFDDSGNVVKIILHHSNAKSYKTVLTLDYVRI